MQLIYLWSIRRLLQARRGYQSMLSERLGSPAEQLSPASGAIVSCAALFEQLLPSAGGAAAATILAGRTDGTPAAIALYEQALAAAPMEVTKYSRLLFLDHRQRCSYTDLVICLSMGLQSMRSLGQ